MTKIVLLGDLGADHEYHAGDEAMAEAAVDELGTRLELEVVALSGHPRSTRERYGWTVVPRIGFGENCPTDDHREERLAQVVAAAGGDANALAWADPAWEVIRAVAAVDGVLISGGGNLSSTWPEHIYERAALARVAAVFTKPLVVSGQTFGPHLTARHGELLAQTLTSAALVGAREGASRAIAARLGVAPERATWTVDDAAYLDDAGAWEPPVEAYVAATFAPHSGLLGAETYVELLARLVAGTVRLTGLDVVLVPHHGSTRNDTRSIDVALHDAIRDAAGDVAARIHSLPILPARATAAAARGAQLVLSSRYHPAVFALDAAVPTIGIATDVYTSTKIGGAMDNYGAGAFTLPAASLLLSQAEEAVSQAWQERESIRAALQAVGPSRREHSSMWWDAVAKALAGSSDPAPDDLPAAPALRAGGWSGPAAALRGWTDALSGRISADKLVWGTGLVEAEHLTERVTELELEVATLRSSLDEAADDAENLRAAAHAAQLLAGERLEPIAAAVAAQPTVEALTREINALKATRTFRYTRLPRLVYSRLRLR